MIKVGSGHRAAPIANKMMYAAYWVYYPGKEIGPDTLVKILHFARYAETAGGVVLL